MARVNDYIELFSAPPFATGRNGVHSVAEPDALRVIIQVSKFEGANGKEPNFVHWNNFVVKGKPDESRDSEKIEHDILRALHEIGGDGGVLTPSEILAEATGIPLQDVQGHLALLEEGDKVELVVPVLAPLPTWSQGGGYI